MRKHAVLFAVPLLIVGVGLSVADGDGKGDAVAKDFAALKGTWAIVLAERDGKIITDKTVTFSLDAAGRATVKKGDKVLFTGSAKIDPTKKPKTYDVTQDSEGDTKGKTFPGVYELDRDTLKICSAGPGKDRPAEFAAKPGSGHFLRVYMRGKK